jgi:hypothetical protein
MSIIANYPDSFTRKTSLVVAGFGLLFWGLIAVSYITPNPVAETLEVMVWLGLFCVLGVIIILGIMSYGLKLWLKPTLVCLAFILSIRLVAPLTNALDDWWLKSHLSEFDQLVSDIKTGTVQTSQRFEILENSKVKSLPGRVIQVSAVRCGHETAVIELTLSNAGRVATGYLFDDCDDPKISVVNTTAKRVGFYVHPILGHWYKFTE